MHILLDLEIKTGLHDEDYKNLIFWNFNKYQINLKDEVDKNKFKLFLSDLLLSEQNEQKLAFPVAGSKGVNKSKVNYFKLKNKEASNRRIEEEGDIYLA